MARILIDGRVLAHAQTSGVQRYVAEICRHLIAARSTYRFEIARPPTRAKVVHHLWEHANLPWRCASAGFDLLFCPANIAPLINGRAKLVVTVHGIAFRYSPESYSKSFYHYYSYLVPRSLRRADAVISVSHAEKKSILLQYPSVLETKIHVVPSGIDHRVFNREEKQPAHEILQRRYGITGDFVLAVGSFKPVKNFSKLLEAYSSVSTHFGAGPFPSTLDPRPSKLVLLCGDDPPPVPLPSNVVAVGYVEGDIASFYQAATCLVCPSLYEGFGFPVLEAMACGCPVIASRAGALPEICADAACYIDAHDAQSIADGITKVMNDGGLRNELIERGCRRVKEFTWERTAKDTLKVFDSILAASS